MHQPIKRMSLQKEIIEYVQKIISDQHLKPGDKLPSQGEMMEMMQVSRTALREAIKTLEAKGVVEVKNGKGVYVASISNSSISFDNLLGDMKEKELLLEILQVRRFMENEVIEMLINTATDEELDELGEISAQLMDKVEKGLEQTDIDKNFHYKIYELCHNRVMQSLICSLNVEMDRLWRHPLHMEDPFKESMPYHGELYQALKERDLKRAQKINRKLLDCVEMDIINH